MCEQWSFQGMAITRCLCVYSIAWFKYQYQESLWDSWLTISFSMPINVSGCQGPFQILLVNHGLTRNIFCHKPVDRTQSSGEPPTSFVLVLQLPVTHLPQCIVSDPVGPDWYSNDIGSQWIGRVNRRYDIYARVCMLLGFSSFVQALSFYGRAPHEGDGDQLIWCSGNPWESVILSQNAYIHIYILYK